MSATVTWAARVAAYLAYRRSFGFELRIDGRQLETFAHFADQRGAKTFTLELAADWARASKRPNRISWARRIEVLRSFARFCLRTDAETIEVPAGKFDAFRVTGNYTVTLPDGTTQEPSFKFWFADGTGVVRLSTKTPGGEVVLDLKAYRPAKP